VYPTTTSGAPNDAVAALAMVTLPALAVPVKVTGQPADKQIDFLNGPWMQAGDRFSIVLTSQTPVGAFSTEYLWLTTPQGENPYPQNAYGKSQTNPTWSALAGSAIQDHTFSTFVVVPEPSALAGMTVGLFVARRARKFAQQLA
jgi:hypothetical protein